MLTLFWPIVSSDFKLNIELACSLILKGHTRIRPVAYNTQWYVDWYATSKNDDINKAFVCKSSWQCHKDLTVAMAGKAYTLAFDWFGFLYNCFLKLRDTLMIFFLHQPSKQIISMILHHYKIRKKVSRCVPLIRKKGRTLHFVVWSVVVVFLFENSGKTLNTKRCS